MAGYNGAGLFVRSYNWTLDAANSIPILAARFDTEDNGFAAGLSNCITKDGQQTITADIPFNGHKITGLGDAVSTGDAISQSYGDTRYGETRGSFTGTYTGMTGTVTVSCQYIVTPNLVTLYVPSNTGTSNTMAMTLTGFPAAIQGSLGLAQSFSLPGLTDNGAAVFSGVFCTVNAAQTFLTFVINGSASGFTNSGTKGVPSSFTITYKKN